MSIDYLKGILGSLTASNLTRALVPVSNYSSYHIKVTFYKVLCFSFTLRQFIAYAQEEGFVKLKSGEFKPRVLGD